MLSHTNTPKYLPEISSAQKTYHTVQEDADPQVCIKKSFMFLICVLLEHFIARLLH